MHRWSAAVLVAALGAAFVSPAAAQWKWVDKNRQVQYSDLPPPSGTPEQDILQRPSGAARRAQAQASAPDPGLAPAPALTPKAAEPELEARRRKAEQDEAAKKKTDEDRVAAARAENCKRARAQMRTLDTGIPVIHTDEKGERSVLGDAARAAEVKRTRDAVDSDCK